MKLQVSPTIWDSAPHLNFTRNTEPLTTITVELTLTLFQAGRYHLRFRCRHETSPSRLCLSPYRTS